MESGLGLLAEMGNLADHMKAADLIITGEGRIDGQSLGGKAPIGISRLAKRYDVPVVVFTGAAIDGLTALPEENIAAIIPIVNEPMTLTQAMTNAPQLLTEAVERSFKLIGLGTNLAFGTSCRG